jgi:predicted nuclease of restriction endonuclease-like (RecB) superfamily
MLHTEFSHIVQLIQFSQNKAISLVNTELINLYWKVGGHISLQLQNASWGDNTVGELATFIKTNHPEIKGFNRPGLYRMRQFYEAYVNAPFISTVLRQIQPAENELTEIVSAVVTLSDLSSQKDCLLNKINWSHHLVIMSRCRTNEEREFYIRLSIREKYSVRELERQISSGVFERSLLNTQLSPLLKETHPKSAQVFKDSYVFEFLNLQQPFKETELQKALISQMKAFILELGRDFLFVGEEYKLQVGNSDFYLDILFYHRGLQCLIAFELKADKFKPEHLGQLSFYLEALDRDVKKGNENPSIGVLLCKDKDEEVVEYALSRSLSPTLVSEYQMQLPNKALLQKKLHQIFKEINSK